MKWHPFVLSAVLVFLLSTSVFAEYYQYTDENNVVRFTDDMTLIPEQEKLDVKTFESVHRDYLPDETEAEPMDHDQESPEPTNNEFSVDRKEIDVMREEVHQSYILLEEEKKALGDPPSKIAKTREKKEYEAKVAELNRKIDEYHLKREELKKKVQAFNSKIKKK